LRSGLTSADPLCLGRVLPHTALVALVEALVYTVILIVVTVIVRPIVVRVVEVSTVPYWRIFVGAGRRSHRMQCLKPAGKGRASNKEFCLFLADRSYIWKAPELLVT
jgi:hypothetical protein